MISCPRCGQPNKDLDIFCGFCGAPLARAQQPEALPQVVEDPIPARLPVEVRQAPPVQPASVAQVARPKFKPGDVICGACGYGSPPGRHFCRHCGAELERQEAAAGKGRPADRRQLRAGQLRPGRSLDEGGAGRILGSALRGLLLVAVLTAVFSYAFVSPVREQLNAAVAKQANDLRRQFRPQLVEVHPRAASGSSAIQGHAADQAVDGFRDTYWAADLSKDANPVLVVTFDKPVDFDQVVLISGASDDFTARSRPQKVTIVFSDGNRVTLSLADDKSPQTFPVAAHRVTTLEVHVDSVYPGLKPGSVALTEVRFVSLR